jgi:prepilin signal peptidase PulO-like enzyme (type II secretory pathway)
MIEAVSSLATVLPFTIIFSLFVYKKLTPAWDSRENYGYTGKQWKKPLISAVIVSTFVTFVLALVGVSVFISGALGLLVFFLTSAALTDAKSHLIPRELSNMALLVGLGFAVVGFFTGQYYQPAYLMDQTTQLTFQLTHFGMYMLAISLLFVVIMFSPVIGFGDIKMFWVTGLFIGSFFMITQLLMIFMLSVIIMGAQLVSSMVKAKSWKVADGLPALPAFALAFIIVTLATNVLAGYL